MQLRELLTYSDDQIAAMLDEINGFRRYILFRQIQSARLDLQAILRSGLDVNERQRQINDILAIEFDLSPDCADVA